MMIDELILLHVASCYDLMWSRMMWLIHRNKFKKKFMSIGAFQEMIID